MCVINDKRKERRKKLTIKSAGCMQAEAGNSLNLDRKLEQK